MAGSGVGTGVRERPKKKEDAPEGQCGQQGVDPNRKFSAEMVT